MNKEEMEKILYTEFEKFKNETLKKYVKPNYELYQKVNFANLEWFVTNIKTKKKESYVTLILADKLPNEIIEKIFPNDMYDSDYDVCFDKESYDWKLSTLRNTLNTKFLEVLGINKNGLVEMTTNYAEDEYVKDFVRIPTLKECRELPRDIVRRENTWSYFLMDKNGTWKKSDGTGAGVFEFGNHYCSASTNGGFRVVRPVITVRADALGGIE